jgi:hypothetical protein
MNSNNLDEVVWMSEEKWRGCKERIVFFWRKNVMDVMGLIVKGERRCVDVIGEMMVNSEIA